MQPSPTNLVFPSAAHGDLSIGSSTLTSKPEAAELPVLRRPLLSGKRVTPLNRSSTCTSAHKVVNFQTADNLGRGVKGSILIANGRHHQRNYVPPLEYYTKGSLLKVPDHIKSRNPPGNKTLTTKKLSPIDPVLSPAPDQVSA